MIKNIKFLKYFIQYEKDIEKIRRELSYCNSWSGQHFSRPFQKEDLPFNMFYYILSNGYVSGKLVGTPEIINSYYSKLINSKAKNVSAVKKCLNRQAEFLKENYSLTNFKEDIVIHEYYPQQLGLIHTTQVNVFQDKISTTFYCLLISLNTNKVISKNFSFIFNMRRNRYESENEGKSIYTADQIQKMNEDLNL